MHFWEGEAPPARVCHVQQGREGGPGNPPLIPFPDRSRVIHFLRLVPTNIYFDCVCVCMYVCVCSVH